MKPSTILSLPALAASAASAQDYNETEPFTLKIANAANETLNGQTLYACHAGAAIEGLCISETVNSSYTLSSSDTAPYGSLIFKLPVNINGSVQDVPSPLSLEYSPASNVAVPLFLPSGNTGGNIQLGFDSSSRLYIYSPFDDSKAVAGATAPGDIVGDFELRNWYACYTLVGGYYYHAIAWVTAGEPHNPTCEAVEVVKEDV